MARRPNSSGVAASRRRRTRSTHPTDPPAGAVDSHSRVSITDVGRRLLDGHDDDVTRNGIERWIGGVHLSGHAVRWRRDEGTESITTD